MEAASDKARLDAAFTDLYRAHLRDVYSYAYYRVGNHHDAEDLTEQTFLQAYRHFERAQRESQGRPQRPALRLPLSTLEVPVRLQERLLREVLGVVVVAHPVVGVRVHVAQMGAIEVREGSVEPGLVGCGLHRARTLHPASGRRLGLRLLLG